MSEYSIDLSKEFLKLARIEYENERLDSDSLYGGDLIMDLKIKAAMRAFTYLCLLSCEISLKALLEKSGMPVEKIKKCSHDIDELHLNVGFCEIEGLNPWVGAFDLFCDNIQELLKGKVAAANTVGGLIDGLRKASKYPNEIRYGDEFRHYKPEVVLKMTISILKLTEENWDRIRYIARP